MTIPIHRLQNGALLLFRFFMISDPKTTPDSRTGRILFALLVAVGAAFVQFNSFDTTAALEPALSSLTVPLLDGCCPLALRVVSQTPSRIAQTEPKKKSSMNPFLPNTRSSFCAPLLLIVSLLIVAVAPTALAFCASMFPRPIQSSSTSSQVVLSARR
jgi:hypothetical protein